MKISRLPSTILTLLAAVMNLTAVGGYRRASLPGGDFETDAKLWPLTSEYRIGPWGHDGGMALLCERTAPGYAFMARPITLKHGASYRLTWWEKIDGTLPGDGAAVSVDWFSNGGSVWVSFTMLGLHSSTDNEWVQFSGEFTAPSNPDYTFMLLAYLRSNTTGRVWFDDFVLEEITGEAAVYPLNTPQGRIPAGEPLDIRASVSGDIQPSDLAFRWLDGEGAELMYGSVPVCDGAASVDASALQPGKYTLELLPLGGEEEDEPQIFSYPVEIVAGDTARVTVDALGRCLVDGKPFMPLGWYVSQPTLAGSNVSLDCDLNVLAKSPFNTIVPYNGVCLKETELTGREAMLEGLDACQKAGQMVLYSLAHLLPAEAVVFDGKSNETVALEIVEQIKDHPAMLGWYVGDERPKNMVPEMLRRRRLLNDVDPNHLTWAVFCSYSDLPYYGGVCDVFGIDPYPINAPDNRGIASVSQALKDTRKAALRQNGTMALWSVVQSFNNGLYSGDTNDPDFFTNTRPPSEKEMTAMSLCHAINGAKGFIFYSEFDLRKFPENQRYDERWAEACRIGELLRSLEPFIMSEIPPAEIDVSVLDGDVQAAAMRDADGRTALMIVSSPRGENAAEISGFDLPAGLVSRTGATVEIQPGVYRFKGTDAEWDVLIGE